MLKHRGQQIPWTRILDSRRTRTSSRSSTHSRTQALLCHKDGRVFNLIRYYFIKSSKISLSLQVVFVNHTDRTTTLIDPRIPRVARSERAQPRGRSAPPVRRRVRSYMFDKIYSHARNRTFERFVKFRNLAARTLEKKTKHQLSSFP